MLTTAGFTCSTMSANDSVSAGAPTFSCATAGAEPIGDAKRQEAGAEHDDGGEAAPVAAGPAEDLAGPVFASSSGELGWEMHAQEPPFCEAGIFVVLYRVSEIGITAAFRLP